MNKIEYDHLEFNNTTELENYIRLQHTINNEKVSDAEIKEQVKQVFEAHLFEDDFDQEHDDRFVSLESMQEDELFDDYDLEHEQELSFE